MFKHTLKRIPCIQHLRNLCFEIDLASRQQEYLQSQVLLIVSSAFLYKYNKSEIFKSEIKFCLVLTYKNILKREHSISIP